MQLSIIKNKKKRHAALIILATFFTSLFAYWALSGGMDKIKSDLLKKDLEVAYQKISTGRDIFTELNQSKEPYIKENVDSLFIDYVVRKIKIGATGDALLLDSNLDFIYQGSPDILLSKNSLRLLLSDENCGVNCREDLEKVIEKMKWLNDFKGDSETYIRFDENTKEYPVWVIIPTPVSGGEKKILMITFKFEETEEPFLNVEKMFYVIYPVIILFFWLQSIYIVYHAKSDDEKDS